MKLDKGIYKDCDPVDQPQSTYRHAMNMVFNRERNALTNEGGAIEVDDNFDSGGNILNTVILPDGRTVLFVYEEDTYGSSIQIFEEPDHIKPVIAAIDVDNDVLNFDPYSAIKAVVIQNVEGENLVVWQDRHNTIRFVNVDNPGFTNEELNENPSLLKLFPDSRVPVVAAMEISEVGGNLRSGTYQFSIAYELETGVRTDYLAIYNPIPIYKNKDGWSGYRANGSESGILTTKAIELTFRNVDTRYKALRLAVVFQVNGTPTAFEIGSYSINPSSDRLTITYDGTEVTTDILLEDVLINNAHYTKSNTLAYTDKKLYLGGVEKEELYNYQEYANNIGVNWTYDKGDAVSLNGIKGSYKDGATCFFRKSFMPDEVYAFYIHWILKDGSFTPGFHIPGRTAIDILYDFSFGSELSGPFVEGEEITWGTGATEGVGKLMALVDDSGDTGAMTVLHLSGEAPVESLTITGGTSGATASIDVSSVSATAAENDLLTQAAFAALAQYDNDREIDTNVRFFHTRDTARPDGTMGYWENQNEKYPDDFPSDAGEKVRHHKFPSLESLQKWARENSDDVRQTSWAVPGIDSGIMECDLLTDGTGLDTPSSNDIPAGLAVYDSDEDALSILKACRLRITPDSVVALAEKTLTAGSAGTAKAVIRVISYKLNGSTRYDIKTLHREIEKEWRFNYSSSSVTLHADARLTSPLEWISLEAGDYVKIECELDDSGTVSGSVSLRATERVDAISYWNLYSAYAPDGSYFVKPLGIQFSNIQVPDELLDKVQGFTISYAKRNFYNSTVIAQGLLLDNEASGANNFIFTGTEFTMNNPDLLGNDEPPTINPAFIKHIFEVDDGAEDGQVLCQQTYDLLTDYDNAVWEVESVEYDPYDFVDRKETRAIITLADSGGKTYTPTGSPVGLLSALYNFKQDVYRGYQDQQLISTGVFIPLDGLESTFNTGDRFIASGTMYGGDVFANEYGFRTTYDNSTLPSPTTEQLFFSSLLYTISNVGLRLSGEEYGETFYPKVHKYAYSTSLGASTSASYTDYGEAPSEIDATTEQLRVMDEFDFTNYIVINRDFNKLNDLNDLYSHEWGKEYLSEFPYRIIVSDIGSEESDGGHIRVFKPGSYYEMSRHRGRIMNLESHSGMLLIHCYHGLFKTVPQTQLQGVEQDIVLGSGDVFRLPPDEILPTPEGYAGLQDICGALMTKAGYCFIDRSQGKIFLLSNELQEISNFGMYNYFKDNLEFNLLEQFRDYDTVNIIGTDAVGARSGVGFRMAYDPVHERIIITKFDYSVDDETDIGGEVSVPEDDKLYVQANANGINRVVRYDDGSGLFLEPVLYYASTTYATPIGWTWSFSLINRQWISEHSYRPLVMFRTSANLYATLMRIDTIVGGVLCRMNVDYYNGLTDDFDGKLPLEPIPSYVDAVFTFPDGDHVLSSVQWVSKYINNSGEVEHRLTWNQLLIYNSYQCSDYVTVVPGVTGRNARKVRGVWNCNDFRDLVDDPSAAFMDVNNEPDSSNIDSSKDWRLKKRFIDRYVIVRLGDTNVRHNVIYLYDVDITHRPVYR